jgi:TonB-linked SusC/RagA family outer membrane protein
MTSSIVNCLPLPNIRGSYSLTAVDGFPIFVDEWMPRIFLSAQNIYFHVQAKNIIKMFNGYNTRLCWFLTLTRTPDMRIKSSLYLARLTFCIAICLFSIHVRLVAQEQALIRGVVRTQGGKPVPGASVLSLSTAQVYVTDERGNFSVPFTPGVSGGMRMEITAIGYRKEVTDIPVGQPLAELLQIRLVEDPLGMEEVVVTGSLRASSRKELGNAISVIDGKDVSKSGTSHLSGYLNGRIMGGVVMQNSGDPAGGFSLKLRGVGSIFSSSEPLYMIDGVIIDNSSANMVNLNLAANTRIRSGSNRLVDINPHDIERIEVVNGPAAATVYGSRAANGVVQIFTRKGRKGKPEVMFSSSVNFNTLARRIDVNEYPFRFGIQQSPRLDVIGDNRTLVAQTRPNSNVDTGHGPRVLNRRLDTTRYPVNRYDYQDDIFSPAWGTDQHLSVRGGDDRGSYATSLSYLNNGGIMEDTRFRRYGLTINGNYKLNSWVNLRAGLMYSNSFSEEKPNSIQQFSPLGAFNHTDNVYDIRERDERGNLRRVEWTWMNPLTSIETHELTVQTNRTIANLGIELKPVSGLSFIANAGLDTYGQEGYAYQARVPYTGLLATLFPDGYVSASKQQYLQWTVDLMASYAKDLGERFTSATTLGYNGQYIRSAYQAQEGRDLLPEIRTISAAQNFFNAPVDTRTEQTIWGYFLQQTFGYRGLLHLTLAGRFDGSSAFGAETGTVFYPKAGLSFSVSDLPGWKKSNIGKVLNTLHLRASYGKAGNLTGLGPYDRYTNLLPFIYYNGIGGLRPTNQQGNESIRPEIKSEWEGGADMDFLMGRMFARFTVFQQRITDLIIPFQQASSIGYPTRLDNLGTMENKGFEIMLGGTPVQTEKVSWNVSLLINRVKNTVTELYTNAPFIGFDAFQGVVVGKPAGVYYATFYARNPDGSLLLRNVDGFFLPQAERGDAVKNQILRDNTGQPTGTPINKVLGDPNPDYTATLVNEVRFGKWNFRLQLDRAAGFDMFNYTYIIRNNIGNGKQAERELRGELTRGWVGAVGGQIAGPVIWEDAVQDASFTRIRECSLGYAFTPSGRIKRLECILSGRNLYTFTNYEGFDPETNTAGQSVIRGVDYSSYPIPRVLQFSVVATF